MHSCLIMQAGRKSQQRSESHGPRCTGVQWERTLERCSVHRLATTMLSASCATMSVLLKKKWPDMDSSRGYETLDWRGEKIVTSSPGLRCPKTVLCEAIQEFSPCRCSDIKTLERCNKHHRTWKLSSERIGSDFCQDYRPHMPYVGWLLLSSLLSIVAVRRERCCNYTVSKSPVSLCLTLFMMTGFSPSLQVWPFLTAIHMFAFPDTLYEILSIWVHTEVFSMQSACWITEQCIKPPPPTAFISQISDSDDQPLHTVTSLATSWMPSTRNWKCAPIPLFDHCISPYSMTSPQVWPFITGVNTFAFRCVIWTSLL